MRDVIGGPMDYAVIEEIPKANPVTGILRRLKLERDKKITTVPFTFREVDLLLSSCVRLAPEYYEFFLCMFRTVMRLGEAMGLHWGDVDWNGKFIQAQRSAKRGRADKTKTGKDRRVDMSDHLIPGSNRGL